MVRKHCVIRLYLCYITVLFWFVTHLCGEPLETHYWGYKRPVWASYVMRLPAPASVPASCVGSRETTSSDCGRRLMWGPREGWMCYVSTGCVSCSQSGRCCVALSRLYKAAENPLMQSPDVWRLQTVKEASVTLYMKECSGGEEGGVERHLTHFWWISRNENYPDMSETKARSDVQTELQSCSTEDLY